MRPIRYLFVHTAAADIPNVDAAMIDLWHRERGWSGIGYHYVILDDRHGTKADGTVEVGRPEARSGAHVRGANAASIGICCTGHGDLRPLTAAQMTSLVRLLADLARRFELTADAILGHREVNLLAEQGVIPARYRTSKSCPGTKVDMDEIRAAVARRLGADPLADAIRRIDAESARLGEALPAWKSFRESPSVQALAEPH